MPRLSVLMSVPVLIITTAMIGAQAGNLFVHGTISAMNPERHTITVTIGESKHSRTLRLDGATKITYEGKDFKPEDLAIGQSIDAYFSEENSTASQVVVRGRLAPVNRDPARRFPDRETLNKPLESYLANLRQPLLVPFGATQNGLFWRRAPSGPGSGDMPQDPSRTSPGGVSAFRPDGSAGGSPFSPGGGGFGSGTGAGSGGSGSPFAPVGGSAGTGGGAGSGAGAGSGTGGKDGGSPFAPRPGPGQGNGVGGDGTGSGRNPFGLAGGAGGGNRPPGTGSGGSPFVRGPLGSTGAGDNDRLGSCVARLLLACGLRPDLRIADQRPAALAHPAAADLQTREAAMDQVLSDVFPNCSGHQIRAIRRVAARMINGQLTLKIASAEELKPQIIAALKKEDSGVAASLEVQEFLERLHRVINNP